MAEPKRRSFAQGSYKKPVMTQKLKKKLQSVGHAIVVGKSTSPASMAKARRAERLAEAVVMHDEQEKAFAEQDNTEAKQRGFQPKPQAHPLKALPQQLQVKAPKLIKRTVRPQQIVDPRAIAKAVAEEKAAERQVVRDEAAKKIALEAERKAVKELHKPLRAPVASQPAVEVETPAPKEDPGNLFSAPPSKEAAKSNVKPETLAEARQEEELAEERLKKDQEMRAYAEKADAQQHGGFQQDHDACVRDCERMRRREEAEAREAAAEPTQRTLLVQTEPVGSECDCDGYEPKAASAASESHVGHAEEFEAWYSAA